MNKIRWFKQQSPSKQGWLIFVLALVIRIVSMLFLVQSRGLLTTADAGDYIQFANYIINQGLWVLDIEGLRAHAGPGYPLILALDILLSGPDNFYLALSLNCIFSSIAVVFVYRIAVLFLDLKWSLLATFWYLIFIPQIWQVQFLGKESLVFCLFTFSVYAIFKIRSQSKFNTSLVISFLILYTYLIHSDERYFFYFPFWLLFILIGPIKLSSKVKHAFVIGVGILLLMIPWTIRNTKVYGKPIILTERTAPLTDRLLGLEKYDNLHREEKFSLDTQNGKDAYMMAVDSIKNGFEVLDSRYELKLIRSIKEGLKAGKEPLPSSKWDEKLSYALEFWRPFRLEGDFYGHGFQFMESWSTQRILTSVVQYSVLLPLLILGIYFGFRTHKTIVYFLIFNIFLHFGIHTFLAHAITRYRYPIDPLIILVAFWALSQFFSRKNRKTSQE